MKIAVTSASFSKNPILRQELRSHFSDCRFNDSGEVLTGGRLIEFLGGTDAAVIGLDRLDRGVITSCPGLKVIAKYGVGLDNVDLDACREHGVAVGWTPGVNRLSVAEMTIGFMIALMRNLFVSSWQLKQGNWLKAGGRQLSGKTVGIIGAGNIGRELVRLLDPFACRILINDIVDITDFCRKSGVVEVSKEQIFSESDLVSVHTPLTELTTGMINDKVLSSMKNEAFLINTARGPIVRQDHLKHALTAGLISGAAIDVYEDEPPSDMELLGLPNLFCTPHIGGNALEAVLAMGRAAIGHLVAFVTTKTEDK
ncbi:MAG: phosphoglycerate dehydrogenase [Candidatus Wallbacteria bacterium]|nr:phosphoglycerate dehydrogenase [Candidatus Wallbacteria bacterium]